MVRIRDIIENDYTGRRRSRREVRRTSSADGHRLLPRLRHRRGLPVRGQRTHTNARTRKGPRKTVAARRRRRRRSSRQRSTHGQEGRQEEGQEERRRRASRTSRRRSTTRSSRSPTPSGGTLCVVELPVARLQGLAQVDAVRRAGRRRGLREEGDGARHAPARSVFVKGPGAGRESALRALSGGRPRSRMIQDVTPIPHNGCRPPKRRRV